MIELQGQHVLLRKITRSEWPSLQNILATPEVSAWWQHSGQDSPFDDEVNTVKMTMTLDGEIVGMIQFAEVPDPAYRHASIDVFVAPEFHGQGLGTDAVSTVVRYLFDQRGHHRITIDPAVENSVAIRCYEQVGFRQVGVMSSYWFDRETGKWRDGLLMELVVNTDDPTV